jgi:sodium transport system permease protein
MKEGQYYMTPLYMVCLPLTFLTLAPGIELNLFYSLVPITGVALLLRALILGNYEVAWHYFIPVLVPTLVYAAVALRWAIDQFQREDVLFREAERFSLKSWLRHLFRDRESLPTAGEATLCFSVIISMSWFLMLFLANQGMATSLSSVVAEQAIIVLPPLFMAVLLTARPSRTLRLAWPAPRYFGLAAALVLALNPIVNELRPIVEWLFPISSTMKASFSQLMTESPGLLTSILALAIIPGICEEFAFRGFILSGLESGRRNRSAILLSALMFGFLHVLFSMFQQLFNATLLGVILGLLAIRSGSILPGILFHATNNAMAISLSQLTSMKSSAPWVSWIYRNPEDGLYHVGWLAISVVLSAWLCYRLWKVKPSADDLTDRPTLGVVADTAVGRF